MKTEKPATFLAAMPEARRAALRQLANLEGTTMNEILNRAIETELARNAGRTFAFQPEVASRS
jgi:hypothetical protein